MSRCTTAIFQKGGCDMSKTGWRVMTFFLLLMMSILPEGLLARVAKTEELEKANGEEEQVVTATRRAQELSESPSAIYVITAEDIEQSGAINLADVLRMAPGVHVFNISPAQIEVGIRGFSKLPSNKVKLLLDGKPYVLNIYDLPKYDILPVPLNEIERVEILKGPGSVQYGSGAIMGVINVITKRPKDTRGSTFSIFGGEKNTILAGYSYSGSARVAKDKLDYRLSAGWAQTDEWGDISGIYADARAYKFGKFNVALDYSFAEDSVLSFFAGYIGGEDEFTTRTSGIGDMPDFNAHMIAVSYATQHLSFSLSQKNVEAPAWKTAKNTPAYDGSKATHYLEDDRQTNAELEYFLDAGRHSLSMGLGYNNLRTTSDFLIPPSQYDHEISSLWLGDHFRISENLLLNLGARLDTHSTYGGAGSHRISLIFAPAKAHSLRLTNGTSIRFPDFSEGYFGATYPTVYYTAGSGLKPEKATSYEIGYLGKLGKLDISANVFFMEVTGFLGFKYTGVVTDGKIERKGFNLGDANEIGSEVELKYPLTSWLTGKINYTYLEAQIKEEDIPNVPPEYVKGTPHNMMNMELRAKFKNGLSANLQANYVDKVDFVLVQDWDHIAGDEVGGRAKAYTMVTMRLGYDFQLGGKDAQLALSALNLFDQKHDEYPVRNARPGRRILGSFSHKF